MIYKQIMIDPHECILEIDEISCLDYTLAPESYSEIALYDYSYTPFLF